MVASVSVEASQGDIVSIYSATAAGIFASQGDVTAIFNFPSEQIDVSQTDIVFAAQSTSEVEVSQADVIAIFRGRDQNSLLRAWTFSLDGHDFYVLRLGSMSTLIYDVYSEQWIEWQGSDLPFWRLNCGINWIGGEALAAVFGSNAVAGDDFFGVIWFLNPEQPYDDHPTNTTALQYFERITMGQMAVKGREVMPCYAAWLTTDMGAPAYEGAGVTLLTSDDGGKTFDDHGLVTVTAGEFSPEISWYSLGQIGAPGRLFRIVDDGAITRIDGLEMNDPDDGG
jgi:hypothetical protein